MKLRSGIPGKKPPWHWFPIEDMQCSPPPLLHRYIRGMGPRISADIRGIDPGYSSGDIPGQCHGYLRISRRRVSHEKSKLIAANNPITWVTAKTRIGLKRPLRFFRGTIKRRKVKAEPPNAAIAMPASPKEEKA